MKDMSLLSNPAIVLIFILLFAVVGVAFCFFGRKLVEALSYVIFAFLGGVLGLMLGMFLAGIISSVTEDIVVYWIVVAVCCLGGIILFAVLHKRFLYGLMGVFAGTVVGFFVYAVIFEAVNDVVYMVISFAVGFGVFFLVLKFGEKVLSFVTAFLGAMMISYAIYFIILFVAKGFFDYTFDGYYDWGLKGAAVALIMIFGIAGAVKQLEGKKPNRQRR